MPIVSPQLSPPNAVHHIKEHLSRLFVLMYNLLATVNNQEGDVQQRATLHHFRGIKEPGNKVLLTIAKRTYRVTRQPCRVLTRGPPPPTWCCTCSTTSPPLSTRLPTAFPRPRKRHPRLS